MWNIKKVVRKGDYLYAVVPEHPHATIHGYVLLHRIVMENYLGRLLNSDEVVHHLDGNKFNNDINNLQVLSNAQHTFLHKSRVGRLYVKLKCPNCGKIFDIPRNESFFSKPSKYNANFCSARCRGIFFQKVGSTGLTHEMKTAISENLLMEYRKYNYQDNSEETGLQQDP